MSEPWAQPKVPGLLLAVDREVSEKKRKGFRKLY